MLAWCTQPVLSATSAFAAPDAPVTFGILPIGGPAESLEAWKPLLEDMATVLHRPVHSLSVSTYEGLSQAMAEGRVDVAFLSGRLALQAVRFQDMSVVAQLTRTDGSRGYYAVLVARRGGQVHHAADLFAHPNRWRYARGESLSVSGYLVPEAQLFAPHGVDSDTLFRSVRIDNHENCALAVANGEVDVAANNTADLQRFRKQFPTQFQRLVEIWRSTLIPHAVLVVRSDLPDLLRAQVRAFLTNYGGQAGREGDRQRGNLLRIHQISGFAPADNTALVPFADIDYTLEQRRAYSAKWVSETARRARLDKLATEHASILNLLAAPPAVPGSD